MGPPQLAHCIVEYRSAEAGQFWSPPRSPVHKTIIGAMSPRPDLTILVADDDRSVLDALHKTLSKQGYEVLRAATSEQAIAAVQGHGAPVDLLIVDCVMPNVSGPE